MPRNESSGKCSFCNERLSKRGMLRHLAQCAYPLGKNTAAVVQLRVDNPQMPHWLDLDIKTNATLLDLDGFLREIWLECCGHLSDFQIAGLRYVVDMVDWAAEDEHSMNTRVLKALPPAGTTFGYEYDYGSTTVLRLKVIAHHHAPSRREAVRLLARNEPPVYECTECGKPATSLCAVCQYEDDAFLCEPHAADHECGEERIMPVVNSPRMGVCGYGDDD